MKAEMVCLISLVIRISLEPLVQVLIYAHPCIMSRKRAAVLEEYVAGGGTLILGCRSGYKDLDGHCVMQDLPGLLRTLSGVDIPEFTRTCPGDSPVRIQWKDKCFEAPVFNDILQPLVDAGEPFSASAIGLDHTSLGIILCTT